MINFPEKTMPTLNIMTQRSKPFGVFIESCVMIGHAFWALILIIMQEGDFEFPPNILKNLVDKNEDKRESAYKDVEIIVSKNADKRHLAQIDKILVFFREKYLKSYDLGKKQAGLEVLPALLNGLSGFSEGINRFGQPLVQAALQCLGDGENKVRMTALKSLYYITKTLDERVIGMFTLIFERLIGKINDMDETVRSAANFFDKSLQTILTGALNTPEGRKEFDLQGFMTIVKEKLKSKNPGVRDFLLKWIVTLNEIMSIDLLSHVPDLLEDLLFMLGDKQKNLRSSAEECLGNFSRDISEKFEEQKLEQYLSEQIIHKILDTLIRTAKGKHPSYTKLAALGWLQTLFSFFRTQTETRKGPRFFLKVVLDSFDQILQPILMLITHEDQGVRRASLAANDVLMQGVQMLEKGMTINFEKVMPFLKDMIGQKKSDPGSEAALRWMKFLLQNHNDKMLPQIKDVIEKVVEKLCDNNSKGVDSIIESASVKGEYFELLIEKMLTFLFQRAPNDPEYSPESILRKFSLIQDGDRFCTTVCYQLQRLSDPRFSFQIVYDLNIMLVTDKVMLPMRRKLHPSHPQYSESFIVLFKAFKYNPAALASLCLLSQQDELASNLLLSFAHELEVNKKVLAGFCKLASLLESPGYMALRLRLLQRRDSSLLSALSALLMILPQGKLFNMLKNRLQVAKMLPWAPSPPAQAPTLPIQTLFNEFKQAQLSFPYPQ